MEPSNNKKSGFTHAPLKGAGFTLLELVVAMGLSFLVMLGIYMAYFISSTFFKRGTDSIQEQMYVRTLFSRIADDLQFLSRLNTLSENQDELEFEIFNRRIVKTDSNTNDKLVEGNVVNYKTEESKDFGGISFSILKKEIDKYEWWQRFSHSQKPNDSEDIDPAWRGYPDDMRDSTYGKQVTDQGGLEEILEQEKGKEFLISNIKFEAYNNLGQKIEGGGDYSTLKTARSMKVEIKYRVYGRYGEMLREKVNEKTVSTTIHFINFSILNPLEDEEQPEETNKRPSPFLSNFFAKAFFFRIRY
ncbi:MAG: prepilin-type N-terminal cleavage/methylation domain-containing protein [Candidatus Firestonebacteria bacterium]